MKRLLPLIALSLLLLAPSVEAGELDILEAEIEDLAVQIEYLVGELEKTDHPEKRAALEAQLTTAREHGAMLEQNRKRLRAEVQQLRGKAQVLERRAEQALDQAITSRAKLEMQLGQARLTAADEDVERLRDRVEDAEADWKRIEAARVWLDKARRQLDTKRYEEAKKAFEEAKKLLEGPPMVRIAYKDGKVTVVKRVTMTVGPEHTRARQRIRELEEELADLRTRMTDRHPAVQEVTRKLAQARAHLDELDEKAEKQGPMPTIVTSEDGRFLIRSRVVDERGIAVPPPAPRFVVQRTDLGPVRLRLDRPTAQETKERIEHLRAAAHHLHEAGQREQAETLEREAQELEESLNRYRVVLTRGGQDPEVMEAIHGLRREIRQLREEVRELKELIRRERR